MHECIYQQSTENCDSFAINWSKNYAENHKYAKQRTVKTTFSFYSYRIVPYFYISDMLICYMGRNTCYKCGTDGLDWSQEFHRQTGKWKLENHKGCALS
jgi:hypothetical protein